MFCGWTGKDYDIEYTETRQSLAQEGLAILSDIGSHYYENAKGNVEEQYFLAHESTRYHFVSYLILRSSTVWRSHARGGQ